MFCMNKHLKGPSRSYACCTVQNPAGNDGRLGFLQYSQVLIFV